MNRRTLSRNLVFAFAMTSLGACMVPSKQSVGQKQVDGLVEQIQHVQKEVESSQTVVHAALAALDALVAREFDGDAISAYSDFVAATDRAEKQARKLDQTIEPLHRIAETFFEEWQADLSEFASADLRKRSQMRLARTRKRYEAIVSSLEPACASYETFNRTLRDYSLFFGHDFNAASLSALGDEVGVLAGQAATLDRRFETCKRASEAYVESVALPARVEVIETN